MTCKYAHDAGYQKAIRKFHDEINEKLKSALEEAKEFCSHQTEYWRAVGKQDVLLEFMDKICDWIGDNRNE